ncbi:hypothetical protein GFS24_01160 [Chitinophaga sp. SYP-B3965]|uniref:hypothetical protein n=1 Tax=Chitinophaga sp. SYP-B3965 TaxID=2663120 RepID=UPI001299FEB2|nr:hypothetical protein [Chitinophaga sp. SYP-B3965]MRG43697.1 hypothetical protein [Chitinophaga sp. SYP-B3965]
MENNQFGCMELNPAELQQINGGGPLWDSIFSRLGNDAISGIYNSIINLNIPGFNIDEVTVELVDDFVDFLGNLNVPF